MRRYFLLFVILPIALGIPAAAQEPAKAVPAGDALIDNYLRVEAAALSRGFAERVQSKEEWEKRRPGPKEQYLEMLGLWPLPERTPLNAKVTGTLEGDRFRVEKVHFQSKPGLYVTGNLYLPKPGPQGAGLGQTQGAGLGRAEGAGTREAGAKHPTVLYVCGHSGRGRDGNKTAFQHHGMWFATHGYVCLIIDTLQLGEIPGIHHGTYREGRWWWQAAGYTPAGVECWNGIRAIDYLLTRPEVDGERIAVTGISGGGATTLWIAAADERVKVAVPVSGMSDLENYVSDKVINGHCDCMFMVNTYRWEWTTIAALVAPRPMLVLNSGHDTIFPMSGNERQRQRLEGFYKLFLPKPETHFDIGVTPGGHSDNVELRLMAYRWINRHFKNDNSEVSEPPLPEFEGKELRVFPEDKDLPGDRLNARIDETFVPRAVPKQLKDAAEFERWRAEVLEQLHAKCFRDWPNHVPAAELLGEEKSGRLLLATEPGIGVIGFRAAKPASSRRVCLIVLGPDEPEDRLPDWAKPVVKADDEVLLLSPRGCGGMKWSRKNPPNYVERAHALLGRTVDTGRVWDVQSVARWLHEHDAAQRPITVAGRGQAAVLAAYAALLEPCIEEVVAVQPSASHQFGPIFLNVLRVVDVPEALALLAPRKLTLVGARDAAFKRTATLYRVAGAERQCERSKVSPDLEP
jgi:dienelactone hydrolase